MRIGESQHAGPLAWSDAEVNAHKIMPYPPGRWMLPTFPWWIGTGRGMRLKRLPHAVLPGRRHQPTHGHHPQAGHAPRRCLAGERGGQTRGLCHDAPPARRRRLAGVGGQPRWRWQGGGVECGGGQAATPGRVDAGGSGRQRGDPAPRALVDHGRGLHAWSGASPVASARRGAHGAGASKRGRHPRRAGGQRLPRLGVAGPGAPAACLHGVDRLGPRRAPLPVNGALSLSPAGRGVEPDPAVLHATGGRCLRVRASALRKRDPGRWIRVGHDGVCCAPGGRHPGEPRPRRLGQCRTVGRTGAGPIGHQLGPAVSRWQRLPLASPRRATRRGRTAVAPAWWQQAGDARLGLDHQRQHALMPVRPRRPAIPAGAGPDLGPRGLVAVGAPIARNARRVAMPPAGCQTAALGRGGRQAAVAFGAPRGREGIDGPAEGIIMALLRLTFRTPTVEGNRIFSDGLFAGESPSPCTVVAIQEEIQNLHCSVGVRHA
jgi:hypothetical protein